jgi:hypothetical protein
MYTDVGVYTEQSVGQVHQTVGEEEVFSGGISLPMFKKENAMP